LTRKQLSLLTYKQRDEAEEKQAMPAKFGLHGISSNGWQYSTNNLQ
jgi:hypothetical protein